MSTDHTSEVQLWQPGHFTTKDMSTKQSSTLRCPKSLITLQGLWRPGLERPIVRLQTSGLGLVVGMDGVGRRATIIGTGVHAAHRAYFLAAFLSRIYST